jgi:hypothetical protein
MSYQAPNYPDVLGYITDGKQATIGTVQAALAVRPPIVRAGRGFAAIVMLQNLSDANVDITTTLQLPPKDAARKADRFRCKEPSASFVLGPAEVGYLVIPIDSAPDAAPGRDYKLGVDLRVEALSKPRRIRKTDVEAEVNLDYYFFLSEETILRIIALKMLSFSASTRGLKGTTLEAGFGVATPQPQPSRQVQPGWFSLWSLSANSDARPLLERYRKTLEDKVLPRLDPTALFRSLYPVTERRIKPYYKVEPIEVYFITKLMVSVLQLAAQPPDQYAYPEEAQYTIATLLRTGWPTDGSPIPLPHWSRGLLHMLGVDEEATHNPIAALSGPLYDDLLRDAITHGFRQISAATRRDMGSTDELLKYTDYLVRTLRRPRQRLSIRDVYMPLVLGGVIVSQQVHLPKDEPLRRLHDLTKLLDERQSSEQTEQNAFVFQVADEVTDWASRPYRDWM